MELAFLKSKILIKKTNLFVYFVVIGISLLYLVLDYFENPEKNMSFILLIVLVTIVNLYNLLNKAKLEVK